MQVEASDKMHRIIQDAFAEIARRIRANEPTTEWDIAQFMLGRYKDGRDATGADDRGGEREHRRSALHADKGKEFTNQAWRLRVN